MYDKIGSIYTYDLIGFIDIVIAIVIGIFMIRKSPLFLGRTAKFLIAYSVKSPSKDRYNKILSSKKFWLRLEKISFFISCIIPYFLSKDFAIKILRIGNDYYGVVVLSITLWMITTYIFRLDICRFCDLFTPYLALHSSILKMACFFNGCCYGYESSFSFYYNKAHETFEFPIQLVESFLSLILFCFLHILNKKNKLSKGNLFPIFLTLYSANRFIAGFFRCEEKIFLCFTDYQITSFYFFLIGVILLIVFLKFNNRINLILNREPFPGYMKYKREMHSHYKSK